MVTPENYQEYVEEYTRLRLIIKEHNLTKEEFIKELKDNTPLARRVIKFINTISTDDNDYKKSLMDFIELNFVDTKN